MKNNSYKAIELDPNDVGGLMQKPAIICVDDEAVILVSLRDQLNRSFGNQYLIEVAESGDEALEIIDELAEAGIEVPVLISDQIMPDMPGDALLIKVHQQYPKTLKILLTGQANTEAVARVVNHASLYRYISKPWDEADLVLTLTEATRRYFQDKQLTQQTQQLQRLYSQAQKELIERKRVEALLAEANLTLEHKVAERTLELSNALEDLKSTQDKLIMQEKMASLGMLTAGIAHEIKNPLNFVNNFAILSIDLATELLELLEPNLKTLSPDVQEEVLDILEDLKSNAASINEEGQRADSIVRSMLMHSRGTVGQLQQTNINALVDESVNLAYHSIRAIDVNFNARIDTDYDTNLPPMAVVPQDLSRVFLNIVNNACYAVHQKKLQLGRGFEPLITVSTHNNVTTVEVRIKDNGTGIPPHIKEQLFNPFFTTKPAGKGTGLGLSISYDIIVQGHGGSIEVDTIPQEFTEFTVTLPK